MGEKKLHIGSTTFSVVNMTLLLLMAMLCLIPFLFVLSASFSSPEELTKYNFILLPKKFTLDSYKYVLFSTNTIGKSLIISVVMTIIGTLINLSFTSLMAYPLSHSNMFGYKFIMKLVTITLVFGGGMIPTYLVVSSYGMLNHFSAIVLPGAVTAYNLIIFISFFRSIPTEIEEAAKIDGCNDLKIFFQIVLPLSTPLLATFTLMFAVANWNEWFSYVLYINDGTKWSVQVILRNILNASNSAVGDSMMMGDNYTPPQDVVRYCVIIIATVPILVIYPFLQKYFTKGLMLGSVKG